MRQLYFELQLVLMLLVVISAHVLPTLTVYDEGMLLHATHAGGGDGGGSGGGSGDGDRRTSFSYIRYVRPLVEDAHCVFSQQYPVYPPCMTSVMKLQFEFALQVDSQLLRGVVTPNPVVP